MICKTKAELQQELDTGRALISLRASLMESLAEGIDLGTDTIAESIRKTLQFFAGTNHALHTTRANVERLLAGVPAEGPQGQDIEDEDEYDEYTS